MQQNIKPKFEVHEVPEDDKTERTVNTYVKGKDGKAGMFKAKSVKDDRPQYDVYFPNGHSIRLFGDEELEARGFSNPSPLIDMDTGDVAGQQQPNILRIRSQRMAKLPKLGSNFETA